MMSDILSQTYFTNIDVGFGSASKIVKQNMDTNKDGEISKEEFLMAVLPLGGFSNLSLSFYWPTEMSAYLKTVLRNP